jgi:hypothetical protein
LIQGGGCNNVFIFYVDSASFIHLLCWQGLALVLVAEVRLPNALLFASKRPRDIPSVTSLERSRDISLTQPCIITSRLWEFTDYLDFYRTGQHGVTHSYSLDDGDFNRRIKEIKVGSLAFSSTSLSISSSNKLKQTYTRL